MTTLIVAAGDAGDGAAAALSDADFPVERVTTLAAARDRFADADVVVVGDLEDATPADLRSVAPAEVPLVRLGADEAFEYAVPRPVDPADLVTAVRLAERVRTYRTAVDDLYRLCSERAALELDDGDIPEDLDRELTGARRRAERAFRDARRLAEDGPFDRLVGAAVGPVDAVPEAFADLAEPGDGAEEADEADGPVDDCRGRQ